ncbi:mitochondrial cardiolipin hydrolase [Gastrophryne carolinensis]
MVPAVSWKLLGAAAAMLSLGLEGLLRYWRRRRRVREVLFFPVPVSCTEALLSPGLQCSCPLPHTDGALQRFMRHLLSARRSLRLCVFTLSSRPLARAVLLLHSRGVQVSVITDTDYMAAAGSQIGALRKAGIAVRHNQASGFMHHKFAVVDKTLLMTGSMNWTEQAVHTNHENLLITDDEVYVAEFIKEFDRLWEEFDPANYYFFVEQEQQ